MRCVTAWEQFCFKLEAIPLSRHDWHHRCELRPGSMDRWLQKAYQIFFRCWASWLMQKTIKHWHEDVNNMMMNTGWQFILKLCATKGGSSLSGLLLAAKWCQHSSLALRISLGHRISVFKARNWNRVSFEKVWKLVSAWFTKRSIIFKMNRLTVLFVSEEALKRKKRRGK